MLCFFFIQAEDGIRDLVRSRGLGDVYKRQNIGKAHLEGFGGEEGVRKGKTELFRHILTIRGHLFVNGDDPKLVSSVPDAFPKDKVHYFHPSIHMDKDHSGTFLSFVYNDKKYESQLVGDYNLTNIVIAIEIGKYFGVKENVAIEAVTKYTPSNNRLSLIHISEPTRPY